MTNSPNEAGPRSREIFEHEQRFMAPGLQSIALYSQLAMERGEGCTLYDVDGNEYLDFIAGIAVGSLGHSHPHYIKRISEQLGKLTFGSFNFNEQDTYNYCYKHTCKSEYNSKSSYRHSYNYKY